MNARAFLDTNVFVYDIDETASAAKRRIARELIRATADARSGVISLQVGQEIANVALRKLQKPPHRQDLRDYLSVLLSSYDVVRASEDLLFAALDCVDRYRLSWYDALIVSAAVEAGCSTLYSEDLQDGMKIGRLRVVNPFRVH